MYVLVVLFKIKMLVEKKLIKLLFKLKYVLKSRYKILKWNKYAIKNKKKLKYYIQNEILKLAS